MNKLDLLGPAVATTLIQSVIVMMAAGTRTKKQLKSRYRSRVFNRTCSISTSEKRRALEPS